MGVGGGRMGDGRWRWINAKADEERDELALDVVGVGSTTVHSRAVKCGAVVSRAL